MISVVIYINNQPIFIRSAHRTNKNVVPGKESTYKLDNGKIVQHLYEDGALVLVKKMLDTTMGEYWWETIGSVLMKAEEEKMKEKKSRKKENGKSS